MSDRRKAPVNPDKTFFVIDETLLHAKYRGCGNGRIVVDKTTDKVVDFDYLNAKGLPIATQNVAMHPQAGEILSEDDTSITYRANFSCGSACLF